MLQEFEKSYLRTPLDHGDKKGKPKWVKGHKQMRRWLRRADTPCSLTAPAKLSKPSGHKPRQGQTVCKQRGGTGGAAAKQTSKRASTRSVAPGHKARGRSAAGSALPQAAQAKKSKQGRRAHASQSTASRASSSLAEPVSPALANLCPSVPQTKAHRATGWLAMPGVDKDSLACCGVDKEMLHTRRRRRSTGGILIST